MAFIVHGMFIRSLFEVMNLEGESFKVPLGTVICVETPSQLNAEFLAPLACILEKFPWVPVVAEPVSAQSLRVIFRQAEDRICEYPPLATIAGSTDFDPTIARFAAGIAPTSSALVSHITMRLGAGRGGAVQDLFTVFGCDSTKRRKLAAHQLPKPHDWFQLLETLQWLSEVAVSDATQAEIAWKHSVDPKTLSVRCRRLFSVPWRTSAKWPWQARVEQFLRVHLGGEFSTPFSPGFDPLEPQSAFLLSIENRKLYRSA